jgi:hypothetical protein
MDGEDPLYSHSIGYLPDSKGRSETAPVMPDHHTLKNLNTLLVPFSNLDVHLNGVPDSKRWNIQAH